MLKLLHVSSYEFNLRKMYSYTESYLNNKSTYIVEKDLFTLCLSLVLTWNKLNIKSKYKNVNATFSM